MKKIFIFISFLFFLHQAKSDCWGNIRVEIMFYPSNIRWGIISQKPFKVTVRVNTFSHLLQARAVDVEIKFDPNFLEVVDRNNFPVYSLSPHYNFDDVIIRNYVDNFSGSIKYAAASYTSYDRPVVDFVDIYFRAKKEGITQIQFDALGCEVEVWSVVEQDMLSPPPFLLPARVEIAEYPVVAANKPYNPKVDGNLSIEYNFITGVDFVTLKIYNKVGKLIREISVATGINKTHGEVLWDGKDKYGNFVKNGVYIYEVEGKNAQGVQRTKPRLIGVFK